MGSLVTQPKQEIAAFVSALQGERLPWGSFSTLGLVAAGRLRGAVVFNHYYPGLSICMHVAGVSAYWMTPEFLHAVFDYPFNSLRLQRVTALVPKANAASRRFVEHLGFRLEGSMRHALPQGRDLLIYGMLRRECKWIGEAFVARIQARAARRLALAA